MDIAFAFDEGYADHLPAAVESVLQSHPARPDLTIWLLTTAQAKADRAEAWGRQVEGRAQLRLIAAGDEFRSLGTPLPEAFSYISTGMYLRLLLPQMLPGTVQRVLYLDIDVFVNADLSPLWQIPLDGSPLAAVRDRYTSTMDTSGGIPGAPEGIDGSAPYFNSGVLLINTPIWRQMGITERCLTYLEDNRSSLRLPDQDALNLAAYGRWVELDSDWNDQAGWWKPRIAEPARILHFLGRTKPWHEHFRITGYRERYLRLLAGGVSSSGSHDRRRLNRD